MRNNKSKLIILILSIFIIHFSILSCQDTWIQTYTPFNADGYNVEDVVVCSDGGYAINGLYFILDEFGGYEEWWGFLLKTDCDGNLEWVEKDTISFQYENESLAFVETSDGGFISAVSGGNLIKRDADGNREWVINGDFGINSMCNTSDGKIILGGAQNLNIGLRKIDEDGNNIWTQVYPIDNDYSVCKSIIQTQDEGYALTGYIDYYETIGDGDILIMKTDENGDSLWTRSYDGYGEWDRGYCIIEDNNYNLLISGQLDNPNIVGFLWYIDDDGNTIWMQEVDSNIGYNHFSVLPIINDYFVAYCYKGGYHTNIYKFDIDYNIEWQSELIGNVAHGDKCIKISENEGFICGLRNFVNSPNIGLTKLDSNGQVTASNETAIHNLNYILTNFPNPFNTSTTIYFQLPSKIKYPTIEIYNIKGQLINQLKIYNQHTFFWNGKDKNQNNVLSGIYLYRIKADGLKNNISKMTILK